jgi:hypothetical protein
MMNTRSASCVPVARYDDHDGIIQAMMADRSVPTALTKDHANKVWSSLGMRSDTQRLHAASRITILVHPGSCCGSADMHCDDAANARAGILKELEGADAAIVVFGHFTDELIYGRYRDILKASRSCHGWTYSSPMEKDLITCGRQMARAFPHAEFSITGAWAGDACVDTIAHGIGARASISHSALRCS